MKETIPPIYGEFVDLDRTFRELSGEYYKSDEGSNRWMFGGNAYHWNDLVTEYRVIILSEAGSGKTAEIRNTARKLREQGKPAFFIRLEHIPRDFEDAFEIGSYERFNEWLNSNEEGWLLLDSVDEARLRDPGDFELAIRKLSRKIITAKDRAHIVITGRTTAWRPVTDLAFCKEQLPYGFQKLQTYKIDDSDTSEKHSQIETQMENQERTVFKIVALDDLVRNQIEAFVKTRGVEDSQAFLNAVVRADAWSFTSRPQDLEELVEFWIDKGRIGNRLELMRNSIERRLTEPDQRRADARPLSVERARQASRLLAAATTLAQNPTIRVPDGAKNSNGIAVESVLPDWNNKDQATLLSRPIFDEAIYSTVRFHHRSVREYLTAEWVAELLKNETSRRKIEELFFRNQYGMDIVVPTLRPVLPWLIILDEKIRERVRKVAPEIVFEGGDPSQLPLDVRRYILREVCEQMANGATDRSMRDYSAVQRFANLDLTEEVRALLRQYANNEDLTAFLLRMVWLGQMAGALPETMSIALTPSTELYTRRAAFRAVNAIGSLEVKEQIRQSFCEEVSELNRELLAELLESFDPTEEAWKWLQSCLEKSEPQEKQHYVFPDTLTSEVTKFVEAAEVELLPQIVTDLNRLLGLPPTIERRYCEVSQKFQWLMTPACKAVERLVLAQHSTSLESDALAILHKFSSMRQYGRNELSEVKAEFSKLVPAWSELNRALFWFEAQESRKMIDKKRGERLIHFWQVSIFDSLWRFSEGDFQYVAKQISCQVFPDNKMVALSLAFELYRLASRPQAWRRQLKKVVSGNNELSKQLDTFLRWPPRNQESRSQKRDRSKWQRQEESFRKKQEKYHTGWKSDLCTNLDKLRRGLRDKPEVITNAVRYLHDQTRGEKLTMSQFSKNNWQTLIPRYGEDIAQFYRDATIACWRNHKPMLRSEGFPANEISYAVMIGLEGLEIEASETKDWEKKLSAAEIEHACRYAFFELNGFPTWFPKLFELHPKTVGEFLMQEVRYELSQEKLDKEHHYVISDISWSGQWAWNQLAPSIYKLLTTTEPKNWGNLDNLLKIVQGSTLSDDQIAELASQKCGTLRKRDHLARWLAVWTGVAPELAIKSLKNSIRKISDPKEQTEFAMTFVTQLWGSNRGDRTAVRSAFKTPKHLKALYLLMHQYIRQHEDINRTGLSMYSPGLRDHAQDARNNLIELLNQISGKEAFLALHDIANEHPNKESRSWIKLSAKTRAEKDGDIQPWSPLQVREFHKEQERTPRSHRELAELAVWRLLDLKDDIEHGDSSVAGILKMVVMETEMRNFIGRELREKAYGRYLIPQEEELADAKRPDLRFHGVGFDGPVPIELKLADKWSGPDLFERLENQLCGDYLRDNRSNRGGFVLVYRGGKAGWDIPGNKNRVDFLGLIDALQAYWHQISSKFPNVESVTIIGIDLSKRFT